MRRVIFVLFVCLVPILVVWSCADKLLRPEVLPFMEVRGAMVVGDELRLVVETYQVRFEKLTGRKKACNSKGFYVTVNLASTHALEARATVHGLLWDVPDEMSAIGHSVGANFTESDAAARRQHPLIKFSRSGNLLRLSRGSQAGEIQRDEFIASADGGRWRSMSAIKAIDDPLPLFSEDRVIDMSSQFMLLRQDEVTQLFELETGQVRNDRWLTDSFTHARTIENFGNVRFILTEDLRHLVVNPEPIWNTNGVLHETFQHERVARNRADFILVYSRPDPKPALVKREDLPERMTISLPPDGAFSIDGKLLLFSGEAGKMSLRSLEGEDVHIASISSEPLAAYLNLDHFPAAGELIMFELTAATEPGRTVTILRWKYRESTISRITVPIADLFLKDGDELRPRKLLHVLN